MFQYWKFCSGKQHRQKLDHLNVRYVSNTFTLQIFIWPFLFFCCEQRDLFFVYYLRPWLAFQLWYCKDLDNIDLYFFFLHWFIIVFDEMNRERITFMKNSFGTEMIWLIWHLRTSIHSWIMNMFMINTLNSDRGIKSMANKTKKNKHLRNCASS